MRIIDCDAVRLPQWTASGLRGLGSPCRMRGSQKDRGLETRGGRVDPQTQFGLLLRTGETEAWGLCPAGWAGGMEEARMVACVWRRVGGRYRCLLDGEQPPSCTSGSRFKGSGVHLGPGGSEGKTTTLQSARKGPGHIGSLRFPSRVALLKTQWFGVVSRCPALL